MAKTLLAIPDYCTAAPGAGYQAAVGRAALLAQAAPEGMLDADDAAVRAQLMQQQAQYQALLVHTPRSSYYRRLCGMEDECFFVDLALRMMNRGASVRIVTGMAESCLPKALRASMDALRAQGIALDFLSAPFVPAPPLDLVTAKEVERCHRAGRRLLVAAQSAVVTPGAWDAARDWNITIERTGQEASL